MGCIMVRQCQSNTCPVGVCTQDESLRAKFTGNADKVVNLITFYATEVREILARIGARSLDEVIGRADLLSQVSRGAAHLDDLDLNPLLISVDGVGKDTYDRTRPRNEVLDTLDAEIVKDAARFLNEGEKMQLQYAVQNTARTIGTRVSSHIVRNFGMNNNLQPDHLTIKLSGSAGQSLGAFAAPVSRSRSRAMPTTMSARVCQGARSSCVRPCRRRWWRARTRSSATPCFTVRPPGICSRQVARVSGSPSATRVPMW